MLPLSFFKKKNIFSFFLHDRTRKRWTNIRIIRTISESPLTFMGKLIKLHCVICLQCIAQKVKAVNTEGMWLSFLRTRFMRFCVAIHISESQRNLWTSWWRTPGSCRWSTWNGLSMQEATSMAAASLRLSAFFWPATKVSGGQSAMMMLIIGSSSKNPV